MNKIRLTIILLLLTTCAIFASPYLVGKRPEKSLDTIENLRAIAHKIEKNIQSDQTTAQVADLIKILNRILKKDENDAESLQKLAEISFDLQNFEQASVYYQRYLAKNSDDFATRTRYASSLIFLAQPDAALKELDLVLKQNPDFFQAHAFRAIAYAEKGETAKAKEIGLLAINSAPSTEAKLRFADFLSGLGKKKQDDQNIENHPVANQDSIDSKGSTNSLQTNVDTNTLLKNFLSQHPVLSNKYTGVSINNSTAQITVKDFPIEVMPEFAKQSLKEKLNTLLSQTEVKEVVLIDEANKQELWGFKIETKE